MSLVDGSAPGAVAVTVWSLEMRSPEALRPAAAPRVEVTLVDVTAKVPELNRFLYTAVGGDWYWVDRLAWTYDQWRHWVDRPEHHTFVAQVGGAPAGYVELEQQAGGDVEVAYFGLLPAFFGLGLGGWLLTEGLRRAWDLPGTQRVWVHTCTLDGPTAKANYEARGFQVVAVEEEHRDTSEPSPGPWPGANRPAGP